MKSTLCLMLLGICVVLCTGASYYGLSETKRTPPNHLSRTEEGEAHRQRLTPHAAAETTLTKKAYQHVRRAQGTKDQQSFLHARRAQGTKDQQSFLHARRAQGTKDQQSFLHARRAQGTKDQQSFLHARRAQGTKDQKSFLHTRTAIEGDKCPPGVPIAMCFEDQCQDESCAASIDGAECTPYFCGGCNRKWHDADGKDVTEACESQ